MKKHYGYHYLREMNEGAQHAWEITSVRREEGGREKRRFRLPFWAMCTTFSFSILLYCGMLGWPSISSPENPPSHDLAQDENLMNVFQVYRPPPTPPPSNHPCTLLMSHIFAYSYNHPFIGTYQPPSPKFCPFNTITLTLTIISRGRQFDRLALMFLGDIEVFRTSTAEPTTTGIKWTYRKDMTAYLSLWREPQKLIFDLGNLVDERIRGRSMRR